MSEWVKRYWKRVVEEELEAAKKYDGDYVYAYVLSDELHVPSDIVEKVAKEKFNFDRFIIWVGEKRPIPDEELVFNVLKDVLEEAKREWETKGRRRTLFALQEVIRKLCRRLHGMGYACPTIQELFYMLKRDGMNNGIYVGLSDYRGYKYPIPVKLTKWW